MPGKHQWQDHLNITLFLGGRNEAYSQGNITRPWLKQKVYVIFILPSFLKWKEKVMTSEMLQDYQGYYVFLHLCVHDTLGSIMLPRNRSWILRLLWWALKEQIIMSEHLTIWMWLSSFCSSIKCILTFKKKKKKISVTKISITVIH
jgi:hypothetical protein